MYCERFRSELVAPQVAVANASDGMIGQYRSIYSNEVLIFCAIIDFLLGLVEQKQLGT